MSKRMLVNAAQEGEVRVAIVEDQVLEDLSIAVDGTRCSAETSTKVLS